MNGDTANKATIASSILAFPALCPHKGQLCHDGLLLVKGANLQVAKVELKLPLKDWKRTLLETSQKDETIL